MPIEPVIACFDSLAAPIDPTQYSAALRRAVATLLLCLLSVADPASAAPRGWPPAPFAWSSSPALALTSQTISFGALAGKTYGIAPFTVAATSTSGLPVAFTSLTSTVCTLNVATITIIGAGTCTVRASQAGNATYAAAATVSQSFTVAKAAQTITFGALAGKTYGVAPFSVGATASSGLGVTYASTTTAVCTLSTATVTIMAAGTCGIQASQSGNANYAAAANVTQTFVIAKAAQTIAFGSLAGQTFGTAPFSVTASASSALAVSFASTTLAVCKVVSGSSVTIVAAGTCAIQASQAGNANYLAATTVNQSFAVSKAAQTIAFPALVNKPFGTAPFAVTASATSGLAVALSSTTVPVCTVAGTTVSLKAGGTCTIQAAQIGNANYLAAVNVGQSFTVTPGVQTINFPIVSDQLSGIPFTVSASASSSLSVSFASLTTTVCSVSGTTVTPLTVGLCTIQATQAGNASYAAAPVLSRSFNVLATARFAAPSTYPVGLSPYAVAVGDLNGDGNPDFVVTNSGQSTVSVYLGNGDGSFTLHSTFATRESTLAVVLADFNGDGKLDLMTADTWASTVSLYPGGGDGTFGAGQGLSVLGTPWGLAAADLNHDGNIDLIVTNGTLGSTGISVEVMLGNGDGSFRPQTFWPVTDSPRGVAIGDFNGDGHPDLAVTSADYSGITILLGQGDGSFPSSTFLTTDRTSADIIVADFNGDGKPDLATLNFAGDVSLLLGNGDGTFKPSVDFSGSSFGSFAAVGDFNGDGKPDLAVVHSLDNNVEIMLGNGDGTFLPSLWFATGANPQGIAPGDFNRDGKIDLVVANYDTDSVSVLLNTSNYSPVASLTAQAGTPQSAVANATFATRFTVATRDAAGNPVVGATVRFDAPLAGASGSFGTASTVQVVTSAGGIATAPAFKANSIGGSYTVIATAGVARVNFALTNTGAAQQAPSFTSVPPGNGAVNTPYSFTVIASGAPSPVYSVSASALPPGLSLNGISGLINGTPSSAGTYAGSIVATNGISPNASQTFAINIAGSLQTISFATPANSVFGATPFTVVASASSGLPVSFSSLTSGVCSISGATVSLVAAGTCTLQASQTGNAAYAPAPAVSRSFTVAKANQTIGFGALSNKAWGAAPFAVNATASSSLTVAFASSTPGVCTVVGNTVTLVASGTCTIQATQLGDANYNAAILVSQAFSVSGSQMITFAGLPDRALDTPPFTLNPTASSGLPVTLGSTTNAICMVSGNIVTLATQGLCQLQASQPGNAAFAPAPDVFQSFNVTAPNLALTSPPNGSVYTAPANIGLAAAPAPALGALAKVEYFDGATSLGTATSAPYAVTWFAAAAGSHALTARATTVGGATFTSRTTTITVNAGNGATFVRSLDYSIGADSGGGNATGLAFGDFNGDGKVDLAASFIGSGGTAYVLLGIGNGLLQDVGRSYGALVGGWTIAADFNGDGKLDLATAGSGAVSILIGRGDGTFAAPVSYGKGAGASAIAKADLNGDGKLDLVVVNSQDGMLSILLGNGDGTFRPQIVVPADASLMGVAIADFNGDGKADIAVTGSYNRTILLGNGDGTFRVSSVIPGGAFAIAAADFDRDGKVDLVTTGWGDNVSIYGGKGDGTFKSGIPFPAGRGPLDVAVADFNGDGKLDIAATASDDAAVAILLGNGDGSFQAPSMFPVDTYPRLLVAGDVDGDGRPDLAVLDRGDIAVSVLINTSGRTVSRPQITSNPLPTGVAFAPFSYQVVASGVPTPTFKVSAGSMPSGLTMQRNGLVTGTLPAPGITYAGVITASNGIAPDATQSFSIATDFLTQTIAVDPIVLALFPPSVTGRASSGLPVTFTSLTPATCQLSGSLSGATLSFPTSAGTCSIRATQGGNGLYLPAPTLDTTFAFDLNPAAVVLTSPTNNATFASPAAITLTAAFPGFALTSLISKVEFFAGSTLVGTATQSPFTRTWSSAGVGTYPLTAKATVFFNGATLTSAPVVVTVTATAPPTVSVTAPVNNATYPAPANITLTAAAASVATGAVISKVEFFAGASLIGTKTATPYTISWPNVPSGPYTLTAKATDSLGVSTISAPVTVIVTAPLGAATIALSAPPAGASYAAGEIIPITADAATPGRIIDRVEYYADGARVGTLPVPGGFASTSARFNWMTAAPGPHSLTAKVVAVDGTTATSAAISVTIADLMVTLTEPFAGQVYQDPALVRMTAAASEATGGTIARVDFYVDGAVIGSASNPPYTFTSSSFGVGSHTVRVVARDSTGVAISSAPTTVEVIAAPTISLAPPLNGRSVNDDNVSIVGSVKASSNSAVTVNGQVAALATDGSFSIDNVALQPGANSVSVTLNTQESPPVTVTATVNSTGIAPFAVTVDPQRGLAPLTVRMTVTNRASIPVARIEIDSNDDGVVDDILTSFSGGAAVRDFTFQTPGRYLMRVNIFDASNVLSYTATRQVLVLDPRVVTEQTIGVYTGMLERLRQGDIDRALTAVTGLVYDKYKAIFTTLGPDLATIINQLGTVQRAIVGEEIIQLQLQRLNQDGTSSSFAVELIRGNDGIWRIEGM